LGGQGHPGRKTEIIDIFEVFKQLFELHRVRMVSHTCGLAIAVQHQLAQ
jgi:hypothetical protein